MRVRRSSATSAGISPRWTASCRADSVWERRSVGARSLCAPGTSTPALARWRTALASTTNLVIRHLGWGGAERRHFTVWRHCRTIGLGLFVAIIAVSDAVAGAFGREA